MSERKNWCEYDNGDVWIDGRYSCPSVLLESSQNNEIHIKLGSEVAYFNKDDLLEAVQAVTNALGGQDDE